MKAKVIVFPENRKINPYQNLIYKNMIRSHKADIKFFDASFFNYSYIPMGIFNFFIPIKMFKYKLEGYKIFHIHWFGPLLLPTENVLFRSISTAYVLLLLICIKYLLRYKVVWTIHEIIPARKEFLNDLFLRRFVSYISDANIVQSKSIQLDLEKLKFNMSNMYLIPHGNYKEYYKNNISKAQARKELNIDSNQFVFLFIGTIAKHKGILKLFEAFLKLQQYGNIKLIVAGECNYKNFNSVVNKYKVKLKNKLEIHLGFIPEDQLQLYFNLCDVVVLPFINTTNSGSTLLALSFCKPVIIPRIGNLRDLPKEVGYFYNNNQKNGLVNSLKKALDAKVEEKDRMRVNINNFISQMKSWEEISDQTLDVYKKILNI